MYKEAGLLQRAGRHAKTYILYVPHPRDFRMPRSSSRAGKMQYINAWLVGGQPGT